MLKYWRNKEGALAEAALFWLSTPMAAHEVERAHRAIEDVMDQSQMSLSIENLEVKLMTTSMPSSRSLLYQFLCQRRLHIRVHVLSQSL
eukprot:gene18489-5955_t